MRIKQNEIAKLKVFDHQIVTTQLGDDTGFFIFFFVDDKDKGVGISVVNFWNADTKKPPQLSSLLNTARGNCLSRLPFHNINTLHTAPRTPNESKYQMADFARVLQYVIGAALTLTLANVEGSSSLSFTA